MWTAAPGPSTENKTDGMGLAVGGARGPTVRDWQYTDNLADLYLRACERAGLAGGRIFHAANDSTEIVGDFLVALASGASRRGARAFGRRAPNCGVSLALWSVSAITNRDARWRFWCSKRH